MSCSRVVAARLPAGVDREIVCINDCSKDGTAGKLDQLPTIHPSEQFKIIHKPVNEGKGAALRDGFKVATGDIVLVQDADLEYDRTDYPKLLQPILEDRADVVYGSRFIGEPHRVLYYLAHARQPVSHQPEQHVHQSEPDGHGGLLQSFSQVGARPDHRCDATDLDLSLK